MFLRALLCLALFSKLYAQNHLVIYSSSAHVFHVNMNGTSMTDGPVHEFSADSIVKDTIVISLEISNGPAVKKNVYFLEKGQRTKDREFVYALEYDDIKKKAELTFVTVYPYKKLPWPLVPPKPVEDTTYKWRNNVYGHLFELKNGKPLFFQNLPIDGICAKPMPDENTGYILKLLARTQIDSEKFIFAREVVKNNCISCEQLSHLIKSLNFELDKIKLVKEAYANIVDKQKINELETYFRFESSKKEFKEMMKNADNFNVTNTITCSKPISDSVCTSLVSELKLYSTDYEKFQHIKAKGSKLCFTTNQFKSCLNTFVHDREKLDLSKLFYNNITDKENLQNLGDIFSYNESKSALINFIKTQK